MITLNPKIPSEAARLELIKNSGIPHEFRTTVVKEFHDAEDITEVARLLGENEKYYLQQFKDSGSLISGEHTPWDVNDLHSIKERLLSLCFNASVRES